MLINLLPDFFSILDSTDRLAAYQRYFDSHRKILEPYWHNYVIDPDSPHFTDIARATVSAARTDLTAMLERTDVMSLARNTEQQCRETLAMDCDVDVVFMVGVGAANAGELVVDGRGIAFVCLEHFTGTPNAQTDGLGLDPELIPPWLAHEIAHVVRYTSPTSRSDLRTIIANAGGHYSYWDTGRQATLRELLSTKGLPYTSRARLVRGTPRGSTSVMSAVNLPTCVNSNRSCRAPSSGTWITRGSDCGFATCPVA
jgi:hypothetical protein